MIAAIEGPVRFTTERCAREELSVFRHEKTSTLYVYRYFGAPPLRSFSSRSFPNCKGGVYHCNNSLYIFKFSPRSSVDILYSIFQNTNFLTSSSFLFTRLKLGDRLKLAFVAGVSARVRHESWNESKNGVPSLFFHSCFFALAPTVAQ